MRKGSVAGAVKILLSDIRRIKEHELLGMTLECLTKIHLLHGKTFRVEHLDLTDYLRREPGVGWRLPSIREGGGEGGSEDGEECCGPVEAGGHLAHRRPQYVTCLRRQRVIVVHALKQLLLRRNLRLPEGHQASVNIVAHDARAALAKV